ncbi:MAG: hypothetical protein AAF851_01955 [Myxococcota bacterium]
MARNGLGPLLCLCLLACASSAPFRFSDRGPVWRIDDRRPYAKPPKPFYSPYVWDGANYAFFRKLAYPLSFPAEGESEDVNAVDEVPNSSWFTNRLSIREMSPEEVKLGACADLDDDAKVPWMVVGGKPDGANPGFQAKDTRGRRFLVKVDGVLQPERATLADTFGALLFHAAGYWVPCNRVVFIREEDLRLKPGAMVKRTNGTKEPLTQAAVDAVLSKATRLLDGRYRVSVSEFIEGWPISPWRYEGVRKDDPNDAIPHEDRRELRAMRLLASLFDHVDTRQENTLLSWIETDEGLGYTRHYRIDWGEGFGFVGGFEGIPQRLGHAGYFDVGEILVDFVSFGFLARPWHDPSYGLAGASLGYYDAEDFDPAGWRPGYPNPAFERATERDAAWMARIIARLTPAHFEAMVERAHLSQVEHMEAEVLRILLSRRQAVLERYLTHVSPLTWPRLEEGRLCLQDLATRTGLVPQSERKLQAKLHQESGVRALALTLDPEDWVCVALPELDEYGVVDVQGRPEKGPARVHLSPSPEGLKVVGLERPYDAKEPRL